jgi:uncharacterized protein (TIGR02594 family)
MRKRIAFKAKELPDKYKFLEKEKAPLMLINALAYYGLKETKGAGDNPIIMKMAVECGLGQTYKHDSIAWCGLFMTYVAMISNKPVPYNPLWARNWQNFGKPAYTPKLGDVLVFTRDAGGHVGLYIGEDNFYYHVLAGNQGDAVSIALITKNRLLGARNHYAIGQPSNCRQIVIKS